MHNELFDIEFEVPGSPTRYFEFELWVRGMWIMDEADGGDMRQCLEIEDMYFEEDLHVDIEINFIKKWIAENNDKIYEMFKERIKKYDD